MKLAIYARVSTSDQDCSLQLRELRAYAEARGWEIAGEYVDTGWSGAKASRPQLDRLMDDARLRKFDAIAVWKLDRWGRSVSNCLSTIQELQSLGVRWMAITQGLDTDSGNPMSRFMLTIMAAFAELEREMLRERVSAGIRNAQSKGKRLGRPPVVIDRSRVKDLHQQGMSLRQIAAALGTTRTTVSRTLKALSAV